MEFVWTLRYDKAMAIFRRKNAFVLMHKDIPVCTGDYNLDTHEFNRITKIHNKVHLPIGTIQHGTLSLKQLNHWFRWRGIPAYRVGLLQLQSRLGIKDPSQLLDKYYALSVSDTYWIKPQDEDITWDEINFFHHSFDQHAFGEAMFSTVSNHAPSSAYETPNNTLCGYHRKAWFHREDGLYLLKGGSPFYQLEPINEWLAGQIAQRLDLHAIPYEVEVYENSLVSVCKCITDEDTDLVTAGDILLTGDPPQDHFQLNYYISLLEQHGIQNARKHISDMLLLDYLLMNTDRHNQNHGILVNANTMEWIGVAPIFDTGTGLGCLDGDDEILAHEHYEDCKLFNSRNFSHDYLLNFIDLQSYDLSKLDGLPRLYGEKLLQYQPITHISNQRIEDSYKLFYMRIKKMSLSKVV